jgi:hypothetical protein
MFLETTVTPIESSWRGFVTIEMVNKSPRPIRIHAGDGIMQMLFFKGDQPCQISYEDRGGKYITTGIQRPPGFWTFTNVLIIAAVATGGYFAVKSLRGGSKPALPTP